MSYWIVYSKNYIYVHIVHTGIFFWGYFFFCEYTLRVKKGIYTEFHSSAIFNSKTLKTAWMMNNRRMLFKHWHINLRSMSSWTIMIHKSAYIWEWKKLVTEPRLSIPPSYYYYVHLCVCTMTRCKFTVM